MKSKIYPDLESMCRLCLKENAGTVFIFPKETSSDKYAALSIPMRIMASAALEVEDSGDFPKKICTECRLQLEKSYYFRKLCQASDAKIRKHLRLIAIGKTSKVFNQLVEDDDDALQYQDSINFIKDQEEEKKQIEKLKIDSLINEIKLQNEKNLKKVKQTCKAACRKELIPEIRKEVRKELRLEVENEVKEDLRQEVSEQCIKQAKESLRDEVWEECRQLEIKCLLDDLQAYLNNKKKSLDTNVPNNLKRSFNSTTNEESTPKTDSPAQKSPRIEVVRMEIDLHNDNTDKENNLSEHIIEDMNANDDDCDSESNFLIYDMQEEADEPKKSSDEKFEPIENLVHEAEYEDDNDIDSNIVTYEKISDGNIDTTEEAGENTTSTTSYRIEDNEDGEIKFLKRRNNNSSTDEENPYQLNENIMVINIAEKVENEIVEQVKEEVMDKKESLSKIKNSLAKKARASTITRTISTSETKFLTKTYVNPLQRSTDTPKIFRCNDCPMVFSTKPSLERHLRTHRKGERTGVTFQCPECRIVVSCSSALRRHMYVHCEEKPFACNICEKAFVQKEILKRHMQTHTGIKPFQCPHCERSFAQRINLTQHINRTHLKEPCIQQHSCYLCPKRFNHASGLSRHLASHNGVAFQCSECDRTFGDRSSIKRHILNMHSNTRSAKSNVKT